MQGKGRFLKQQMVFSFASSDVTTNKKGVGMWGLGEVSGDERKMVMSECDDLQTIVNRIKDLTGSFARISLKSLE